MVTSDYILCNCFGEKTARTTAPATAPDAAATNWGQLWQNPRARAASGALIMQAKIGQSAGKPPRPLRVSKNWHTAQNRVSAT